MRVLMFGWEFPPHQAGGLATATHGLVKGLLGRGVDVTLVIPFPLAGVSTLPSLRVVSAAGHRSLRRIRIPTPVLPYTGAAEYLEAVGQVSGPRGVRVYGQDLFEEVDRLAAVAADIAESEPHDVIDTHDWITFRAGLAARRQSGRPLVAHIHATEFDRAGEHANPAIAEREWEGLTAADAVISNSRALKHQVVQRYRVPADRISVVHWGIDRPETPPHPTPSPLPAAAPVVLFLGRVTRQKGPDYFLSVARRVADFVPDARFVVAGSGDMLPWTIEQAVALGLGERVHFAGGLAGPDVDRAFRMADVCVMPSVSEPFGLVALESLRSGTPCIIPRESGVAEVVRHALKVDFWDIDEMTNKIVALLRHPALRRELRGRGLAELETPRFGLDEPARRTEAVYQRVAAEPVVPVATLDAFRPATLVPCLTS